MIMFYAVPIYESLCIQVCICLIMHVSYEIRVSKYKYACIYIPICVYHNSCFITGMWEMQEAFSLLMRSRWALAGWAPTFGPSSYREKILYQILLQWANLLEMVIQCHVWLPLERLPKASCHLEWSTSTQWGQKENIFWQWQAWNNTD